MKSRRIEMVAFRRRTTVIMRDSSKVNQFELTPGESELSKPARADDALAAEIETDQIQIARSDSGQSGLISIDTNDSNSD